MSTDRARQAAGQPTGGQFAATAGVDAGLDLADEHPVDPFATATDLWPVGTTVQDVKQDHDMYPRLQAQAELLAALTGVTPKEAEQRILPERDPVSIPTELEGQFSIAPTFGRIDDVQNGSMREVEWAIEGTPESAEVDRRVLDAYRQGWRMHLERAVSQAERDWEDDLLQEMSDREDDYDGYVYRDDREEHERPPMVYRVFTTSPDGMTSLSSVQFDWSKTIASRHGWPRVTDVLRALPDTMRS